MFNEGENDMKQIIAGPYNCGNMMHTTENFYNFNLEKCEALKAIGMNPEDKMFKIKISIF
jgi:hypothetical protein